MRTILCYALAVALAALAYGADTTTPQKKKTAAKSIPTARKAPAKSVSTATRKTAAPSTTHKTTARKAPVTTWRNRQVAPTPERYKEIQDALVAKGYLRPEDIGSGWNQTSVDALKRFQGEQNIEASGKLNSLSLIALGLGPKYESSPTKAADTGTAQDR